MKTKIGTLLIGSFLFVACTKERITTPETCDSQTANPSGRSYTADSVVAVSYFKKQCGFLPLSSKNYWVYRDSIFNEGVFSKVQYDTLRYTSAYLSLPDNLVWWETNISVGLPAILYANDSAVFKLEDRMFTADFIDAKKELGLFTGDSLRYLTNFEDAAAQGRSLKVQEPIKTPVATFNDCLLFEKNARNYRKEQVYFKAGLGVIKYTVEKAPMGSRDLKLQQVSVLVAFHID